MDRTNWGSEYPHNQPVPQNDEERQSFAEAPATDADLDPDYPFEEPEAAPELRQQRSESLYSRSTPFWDRVEDHTQNDGGYPKDPKYWCHAEEMRESLTPGEEFVQKIRNGMYHIASPLGRRIICIMLLVLLGGLVANSLFGTVRVIRVQGNSRFSDAQVIAYSGLEIGMSNLGIDAEKVIERIGREQHYLRCTLVDVAYDTVTIHVRERVPVCCMIQNGQMIVMDDRGWVLEVYDQLSAPVDGLIRVTGLEVTERHEGMVVTLRQPAKLTVYTQILIELRAMEELGDIVELDMTNMDSITMKTTDGLTVLLGNESRVHEKLRAYQVLRRKLINNGYYNSAREGTIIVSSPEKPTYRPPNVQ